ncbi:MAG TPA: hypothetical protein VE359_00520 [Vicinamibacteria bacterium]|nr:hypothetical protein [Vicinamibacteria bacterium]
MLACFLWTRGFGDLPRGRARTAWRALFWLALAWLLLLVALWAAARYYGLSVFDYSQL